MDNAPEESSYMSWLASDAGRKPHPTGVSTPVAPTPAKTSPGGPQADYRKAPTSPSAPQPIEEATIDEPGRGAVTMIAS